MIEKNARMTLTAFWLINDISYNSENEEIVNILYFSKITKMKYNKKYISCYQLNGLKI